MEHFVQAGDSPGAPHGAGTATTEAGALRCGICSRKLGSSVYFVEETGDVPEPRGSWVLCRACNEAVHEQLDASPVRSPLRLRIAVGLVATDRTPAARRARFGQLSDRSWIMLLFWLFLITMLVHLAVLVAIAGIIK